MFAHSRVDFANTLQRSGALHQLFVDGVISLEEYRLALDYDEEVYGVTMYSDNTTTTAMDKDEIKKIKKSGADRERKNSSK